MSSTRHSDNLDVWSHTTNKYLASLILDDFKDVNIAINTVFKICSNIILSFLLVACNRLQKRSTVPTRSHTERH
jgi:hypothetical protein